MSAKIVPSVTLEHCPRCAGFLVQDVLFDGQGWSNFSVQVQRCLMCQRIFEGEREYGLRKDIASTKDAATKKALNEQLNAAIERQIQLDNERTSLITAQNEATRQAALNAPKNEKVLS